MSKADVERFVNDLKSDPALLAQVKENAAGVGAVVEVARSRGYDITVDEARNYIRDQAGTQLSDSDLDAIAGGKGHHSSSSYTATISNVVQTAEVASSVAEAAEQATTAVQDAEAATTVVAVAEAAIVAT